MYSETYPNLYSKYQHLDNFNIIAEAVDLHFNDLFKLNVLDNEAKIHHTSGSYIRLFDECMQQLEGLHTVDEVVKKMCELLQTEMIKEQLSSAYLFVPPIGLKSSKQLSFLEKIAVNEFKVAEPLSFIDMMRLADGLKRLKNRGVAKKVDVVHLNHLMVPDALNIKELLQDNDALLVNLNRDLKGAPKWGVINLQNKNKPEIYCETPLTEREKADIQNTLGMQLSGEQFLGATANSAASTGYTALAWLDNNVTKAWNFDTNADFTTVFKEFVTTYFGADNPGLSFRFTADELTKYCTPEYQAFLKINVPNFNNFHIDSAVHPGFIFIRSAWVAGLGSAAGVQFRPGDLGKAIQIIGANQWTYEEPMENYLYQYNRSLPPAFAATLSNHEVNNEKILQETATLSSLRVPENLDTYLLRQTHNKECSKTNTSSSWFDNLYDKVPRNGSKEAFYATMLVLALVRAKAKKRSLAIDLPPAFQLNSTEQNFIIQALLENPYVTEFKINDNASLKHVKDELTPTFARNRWLAANGYRPPLVDDYWMQAARYWLVHLHETTELLEPKKEHELFKNCILEMGLQGLQKTLELLNDETEHEFFDNIYGRDKPPFYAACRPGEYKDYLELLLKHLKSESYFPFSELGISYQAGFDKKLVAVIEELNKSKKFERISFTDCLKQPVNCKGFLHALIKAAQENKWTGLIVIPELEVDKNLQDDLRELRVMYTLLNDIILHNRHEKAATEELKRIREASDFTMPGTEQEEDKPSADHDDAQEILGGDEITRLIERGLGGLNEKSSWPLKKGGVVQLQLQQQQQIEQQRQHQQEQQKVVINIIEEAMAGELVEYTNIERLLGKYLKEYRKENPISEHAATLKEESETLLQGFFHTWVNANPHVSATHVIQKMTPDAAKALLRKHTRLPSGLNPENLPKGFYTQRSKDGDLILCYSPELSYINPPNALTLDLSVSTPVAEVWEGDFRQFDLSKYSNYSPNPDAQDWKNITLYAHMQPPKDDYTNEFQHFLSQNKALKEELESHREKIIQYWPVFMQLWQYMGDRGIHLFILRGEADLKTNVRSLQELLLNRISSSDLKEWSLSLWMTLPYLRALGQIQYRYGDVGLTLFLSKLRQLEAKLGTEFFAHFSEQFLAKSDNFNCFMNEGFFLTLDDMMEKLKGHHAEGKLSAWMMIIEKHMTSMSWEDLSTLWRGFDYFTAELEQLGLELEGTEFTDIKPENMLISMNRILASLYQIPDIEMQKAFLANLKSLDLTYGGVHYALQHEGFKHFDSTLELHDFNSGSPTYAPDLNQLYSWSRADATLKMKRTLASQTQFSQQAYQALVAKLGNPDVASRNQLLWLLHTQYNPGNMPKILDRLDNITPDFQERIAKHIYRAVYELGNKQLDIQLDALKLLENDDLFSEITRALKLYPYGTVLEAISILYRSQRGNEHTVSQLLDLFNQEIHKPVDYPVYLYREGYKLGTLFGIDTPDELSKFYEITKNIRPVVQNELRLLMKQLLSIDYEQSNLDALVNPQNWNAFLQCIEDMKGDMANTAQHRIQLIEKFNEQGIEFTYSKSGEFRALTASVVDKPEALGFFTDHEDRLWDFMQKHIVVPVQGNAKEALAPIVRFLKKLQLNRTYLNEIEPLLSSLEEAKEGHYWSASYFYQLLRALQPDNDQASFPISLLKVMLKEESLAPKKIDSVEKDFPVLLTEPLQAILKNTIFNRHQQGLLCQIALREYNWQGSVALLNQIMTTLSIEGYAASRTYALEILTQSMNFPDLETRFENCRWLLPHSPAPEIARQWTQTTALWLKALSLRKQEEILFTKIKAQFEHNPQQLSLILHIVAFSTLQPGLRDKESYLHDLNKKASKLVDKLSEMQLEDLILLANAYPNQPAPSAEDILRLLKMQQKNDLTWSESFETFERQPFPEPRTDYGTVASARDADLQRMIADTKVSGHAARQGLEIQKTARLTLIFSYLKQLESGTERLEGSTKAIAQMNQQELAAAFKSLSKKTPQDDLTSAQIWAIMFEVLGRTTHKYPHLAQQFALIANDIGVDSPTRVLQLATGEGKSHFVAMRAVRHAGQGKIVDVSTAKRTLAERDLEDYQSLFDYLEIKTAYIHPKSARQEYVESQIHYSTLGDLSLFLDEQSYSGEPIEGDRASRVALFDEFDFIRFEEGRKTEYNYARPTGKTPKQMTWFYQAVNEYYTKNSTKLTDAGGISHETLFAFAKSLQSKAGENEERQLFVVNLLRDPLQLVQWLQSAHEAHTLEWGIGFTVREENIEVGDESYPMREIIPLSTDNQKMVGATFSGGVHQLLAVRLNSEALAKQKPQNFHIHPESNIISSQVAAQRMNELYGSWEGFTGTVSAAQAANLNYENGTQVLHIPTNQRDLRFWHKPGFYQKEDARLNALVKQIRICIDKKQSMLFSCKNDRQVEQLQEQLKLKFSETELKQNFIFYTNEEQRSASEVLDDKSQKENWHGGKKQHAVGLVASGFGRGDNVGVEAVFLFDVNDTNDKLQKGGRTARNGAEGEVFQFYLSYELAQEERNLWNVLQVIVPTQINALKKQLKAVTGENESERCFERVMLLREYVFSLQNAANSGYHNALAQFSSWGMKTLGQIEEPANRQMLTTSFSFQLKKLDKLWIDISSNKDLDVDGKISEIEKRIHEMATEFASRSDSLDLDTPEFNLNLHAQTEIQLVVAEPPRQPTAKERAIASICSVMSRLSDLTLHDPDVAHIPQALEVLAQNEKKLQQFATKIISCTSMSDFIKSLRLAAIQATKPSEAMTALETKAAEEIKREDLYNGVSDSVRLRCTKALDALLPELQDKIIDDLRASNLVSSATRINNALPFLEYLGRFRLDQQENLGADYIDNMSVLTHQIPAQLLSLMLNTSAPLSYPHFVILGNMMQKVMEKGEPLTSNALTMIYSQLVNSIAAEPEQRLRMLTKWESWLTVLSKEQIIPFFLTFTHTMEHFEEGENWDTFALLVKKTQDWINKGGEAAHAPEILELWENISRRINDLPEFNEFLQWGMRLGGKSWYQVINTSMNLSPAFAFQAHLNQFKKYWAMLDDSDMTKKNKIEGFQRCCNNINDFYESISELKKNQQAFLAQQFQHLDNERFSHMLDFISTSASLQENQPRAMAEALSYLSDASISLERSKLLGEIILETSHYSMRKPEISLDHLLNAITRFKDCEVNELETLLQLMRLDPDCTIEPLFDNTAHYLTQKVPTSARESVQEMIKLFYQKSIATNGNPQQIADMPEVGDVFDFENHANDHLRVVWMHLLQQQVFVASNKTDTKHNYTWNAAHNGELTQLGFNQYLNHTKKVLDKKPAQTGISKGRDLTTTQQNSLLQLTDELAIIGDSKVPHELDPKQMPDLNHGLNKLMQRYESTWFKSKERIEQAQKMKQMLSLTSGYQNILQAISQAKLMAMESDLNQNEERRFKINRSGRSRYFNTLNQMQDMVLRHWAQNTKELTSFKEYQEFNKQEFKQLVSSLKNAAINHYNQTYPAANPPSRLGRFFENSKKKTSLENVNQKLANFDTTLADNGDNMTKEMVEKLITELRHEVPQLPGHIVALANEVLLRGDSLQFNLGEQEHPSHKEIKDTFNGPGSINL